ncbi:exodeoxyribonuclease VII small subunit [Thermophilibacter sp.]|uniref:exodeoxyribonuclease VII small subunit n=1 Tax=Thermophilibacter sp. TaxID=2847309 RepID=UPI003A939BB0
MARVDVSRYQTFGQINDRLDELVGQVRDKDVSLERSLDLFDEAVALGSKAVSLVDATDFSPEEEARLADAEAQAEKDGEPADAPEAEPKPAADGQ